MSASPQIAQISNLLARADALLHELPGADADCAHDLLHQAAAHLSESAEIRAQAAAETPLMFAAVAAHRHATGSTGDRT